MAGREHPSDKLVTRFHTSGGTRIEWERHDTGERYGAEFSREEGRAIMAAEGLNPDEFNVRLGES